MFETWLKNDLKKPIKVEQLHGNLFSGDNEGNKIGVELFDNGAAASVSGSVYGYIIRADGVTVPVNGTLDGNKAYIVLPASAYIVVGQMSIVIKVGDMTVGACTAYVYRTTTDAIVDPGDVVPSLSELLAIIGDCQSATLAANSAANSASAAAAMITNMTVSATVISEGLPPTVEISDVDSHKHITFGFPDTSFKANAIEESNSTPAEVMTFADGAEYMPMKVDVAINPVQDTHGYDPCPAGGGKNLLGLSLSSVKTLNTSGTWDENDYTVNGVTYKFIELDGYVERIECSGTASSQSTLVLYANGTGIDTNSYIFSGCPSGGGSSTYRFVIKNVSTSSGGDALYDTGSGVSVDNTFGIKRIVFIVYSGTDSTGKVIYPMLRLSSVTDASFAPYSNICPISGFTGVDISRTGRNLANPVDARPANIIQSTTGNMVGNGDHTAYVTFIPVKPFAKYTLSATNIHKRESNTSNAYVNVVEYSDADRTTYLRRIVNSDSSDPSYTFTISEDANYIRFSVGIGATDVQLEMGENVSDFTPYTGCNKYNITFPDEAGTVYGGTLTVNRDGSGTLVVDRAIVTIDGSESYIDVTSANVFYLTKDILSTLDVSTENDYCSMFKPVTASGSTTMVSGDVARQSTSNSRLYVKADIFAGYTASQLATYFESNNFQICLRLITPVTYNFTAMQIRSLLGENNLWADSGNVLNVVYYADTKMYIDNLFSTIVNGTGVSF